MGTLTSTHRAQLFIKEFGDEIMLLWALTVGCCVESRALAIEEGTEMVRILYKISSNGDEHGLMSQEVYFNPEADEFETVQYACISAGLEEDVAYARCDKVGLI